MYGIPALFPSSNLQSFFCWTLQGTIAFLMYQLPIQLEVGWDPEPVWMLWRKEKILPMLGIEPGSLVLAASS